MLRIEAVRSTFCPKSVNAEEAMAAASRGGAGRSCLALSRVIRVNWPLRLLLYLTVRLFWYAILPLKSNLSGRAVQEPRAAPLEVALR